MPASIQHKMFFLVVCFIFFFSCADSNKLPSSGYDSEKGYEVWYKQADQQLGAKILIDSTDEGYAISRGRGEIKGHVMKLDSTSWSAIFEHDYSDYPLITRYNDSTIWYLIHETHHGFYRPRHYSFTGDKRIEIKLPEIMWDETDFVMYKSWFVFDDGTAWMVGQQGNILFFDGNKWSHKYPDKIEKKGKKRELMRGDLNSVRFLNHDFGFAVGKEGRILIYNNNHWSEAGSPVKNTLNSVFILPDSLAWAAGLEGTILKFNGEKWVEYPSPVYSDFQVVKFCDSSKGWIAGTGSVLLEYNNGEWREKNLFDEVSDNISDLSPAIGEDGKVNLWLTGDEGIYTNSLSMGFSFSNVTSKVGLRENGICGHFFDADNDNDPDLLVQNDFGPSRYYINNSSVFVEQNMPLNIKDRARLITFGDVNNDGNEDVFYYSSYENFRLLLGMGNGEFIDFTKKSGLKFSPVPQGDCSAKLIDLNNDGYTDLYFSAPGDKDYLFINNGCGIFIDRFRESGIIKPDGCVSPGAVFSDFNSDRLPDILIPFKFPAEGGHALLFINQGENKFIAELPEVFRSDVSWLLYSALVADYNNDLRPDIFFYSNKYGVMLFKNSGDSDFKEVSKETALDIRFSHNSPVNGIMGAADFNNDGYIDLFAGSKLFLNLNGEKFTEISSFTGLNFRGNPSFSDFDSDGDIDIFFGSSQRAFGKGLRAALFRNNLFNKRGTAINLFCDKSARSGKGSVISTIDGEGEIISSITVGSGCPPMTEKDNTCVMLCPLKPKDKIRVEFPSGVVKELTPDQESDKKEIYESGAFHFYFSSAVESIRRTLLLAEPRFELLKTVPLIIFQLMLFLILRKKKIFRILKNPLFYIFLIMIYLISLHLYILETLLSQTIKTWSIFLISTSLLLFIGARITSYRESKYIAQYKLLDIIGKGGMGIVYKAYDTGMKKYTAVKVLNPELLNDEINRKRLLNEGKILVSFNHPNIIKVEEIGETRDYVFLAMEYLAGGTLLEFIEKHHPLSMEKFAEIALQITGGLAEIHRSRCIHRDLKSGNIMFDSVGNIRIMDFGLSKAPLVSKMTTLGTAIGTIGYMPPEQVTGTGIDKRADIFSLGVVFYEMATSELPFKGENEISVIHSIFNNEPAPVFLKNRLISNEIDVIIKKMLSKNPADRYQSADEIVNELEKAINGKRS